MGLPLLPQHLADLRRSGIDDHQIDECGFRSETDATEVGRMLNRPRYQGELGPCLVIPYRRANGSINGYCRLKPDRPRTGSGGKPVKYEAPVGHPNLPYFPPATVGVLADATIPLLITEGEKKAARADQEGFASIGISGVWSWQQARSRDRLGRPEGERKLIPDLDGLPWAGRQVFVAFDFPDYRDNPNIRKAEEALAAALTRKGAVVRAIRLPGTGTAKVGLDDFLLDHSAADLSGLMAAAEVIEDLDRDATAEDLIRLNSTVRWVWTGWIPLGVLTILASDPGIGKTRFCADLLRRICLGLPWPDGSPTGIPAGSKAIWVVADNHHPQLGSLPTAFGFAPDALVLNATARNPYVGTMLDAPGDLKDFETRIERVKPALVFIDTSLNATDRTAHKPEDAKAFFGPLQKIAQRTQTALICVTHLNGSGKPLGRRIVGQGRVVIQMDKPDPDSDRRRIAVTKSTEVFPPALGVTMNADGNDYDTDPPTDPGGNLGHAKVSGSPLLQKAKAWLFGQLSSGPKRVGELRQASEIAGIGSKHLYQAKESIGVEEFFLEGKKWWKLTANSRSP